MRQAVHQNRRCTHPHAHGQRRPLVAPRASTTSVTTTGISAEEKCRLARNFVESGSGYFSKSRPELYAEDFVFRGPVVGPLCKKDYLHVMDAFKVYEAFPDIQSNSFGYCIDPAEPNRVRFFVRQTGTNTGPLNFPPLSFATTNKKSVVGPEAYSILLNDEGLVKLLTVGYAVDFDAPGTTCNKFGAVVGLLAGVGVFLPGGQAFSAVQRLSTALQDTGSLNTPRSKSKWEDVPQWYKEYCPRREGSEGAPGY